MKISFELLNSYCVMMPIIKAEEAQGLMHYIQFGTGNMGEKAARSFARDINNQANTRNKHKPEIPKNMKNAILSTVGIAVVDMRSKYIDPKLKKKLFPFNPTKTKD